MIASLNAQGYLSASDVQSRVIPKVLSGSSIVCQSETGTGKTHSYLIPIIERIDLDLPRLQAIIIAPSRELAQQTFAFAKAFQNHFQKLKVRLFTSSEDKTQNTEGLSIAPHIVIGTPGRLRDILSEEYGLNLRGVRFLVLDEADMLAEMGYFEDIDEIYAKLPEKMQTMAFSATLNQGLKDKLGKYIKSDFLYQGAKEKTPEGVRHHLVDVKHIGSEEALRRFLEIKRPYLALVFASKKEDVKKAYETLKSWGYQAIYFSGDLDARERKQAIRLIKSNKYQIVCCSDLLARGIDIDDVSDIVSLDLPSDLSYYFHRAGRTARFGKSGDSWVFYNADSAHKAKTLLDQGVKFDFLTLKKDSIEADPVGLAPKKKLTAKKAFSEEELKEVKIAKAKSRTKKVEPGYKKKRKMAVEKVKRKYRRKAIKDAIRKRRTEEYRAKAKKDEE